MIAKECVGCGACRNICPQECITMDYNDNGYFVPKIDMDKCIHCHCCKNVCPMRKNYKPSKKICAAGFFVHSQEYYRGISSSGGFFHAISREVFRHGGVVFGVYIGKDFSIRHGMAENEVDVIPFLTSKYVQSDTGETYKAAKRLLEQGRIVLYSGTPCQIAGLLAFLGKEPENLLTLEVFCHGVPSQYSWKRYLEDYHGEEEIRYVQFRYKFEGWWNFGLRVQYSHTDYFARWRERQDPYLRIFHHDINLNDTCYHCKFKDKETKNGDFAIGDAWNVNRVRSNMDDNRGMSTVLVNSVKGAEFLESIQKNHHYFPLSVEEALFVRGELDADKKKPEVRAQFMKDLRAHGFRYAVEHNGL